MLTVTSTTTRPSTASAWWLDAPANAAARDIIINLQNDPLLLSTETVESADGLTLVKTFNFNSSIEYQNWISEIIEASPTIFTDRNQYITDNGQTLKVEESVDGGPAVIEKQI